MGPQPPLVLLSLTLGARSATTAGPQRPPQGVPAGLVSPGSSDSPCVAAVTARHRAGYLETARRSWLPQRRPAATGSLWWHRGDSGHPSNMPSTRPFVCPRAKLRSLPWGSPALGLGPFSAKPRAGDSGDLMDFYATTYAVAYGRAVGQPSSPPPGAVGGSPAWLSPPVSPRPPWFPSLPRPPCGRRLRLQHPLRCRWPHPPAQRGRGVRTPAAGRGQGHFLGAPLLTAVLNSCHSPFWDTTMAEHFQPLLLPDGRSLLPRHVHQPGSGYGREQPLPHLRAGAVSPPPASGEHGADPAQTGTVLGGQLQAREGLGVPEARCPAQPQKAGGCPRLCELQGSRAKPPPPLFPTPQTSCRGQPSVPRRRRASPGPPH